MEYKPGDLFFGLEKFIGILVPGALLLFLHGDKVLRSFASQFDSTSFEGRAAFVLAAYVTGHFLLALSIPFNRIMEVVRPSRSDRFFLEVKGSIPMPAGRQDSRVDSFHRAYAFVLLNSSAAVETILRHVADFKFFRSLSLVFALDVVASWVGGAGWLRIGLAGLLAILAFVRYCFIMDWTYRVTFEYYALLVRPQLSPSSTAPAGE